MKEHYERNCPALLSASQRMNQKISVPQKIFLIGFDNRLYAVLF